MSRKGSSPQAGAAGSQGSKSQLLLALKEQVLQLQTQLREEREEREKISSWLTQTLKPRLKQQFEDMNGRLEETSEQVGRIRQFLRDNRAALTQGGDARASDLDALKSSVAIEHEARQQLSLWLKQKIGKNLERLDARYVRAGAGGVAAAAVPPGVAPVPESVSEWLRVVGYERYADQFERAGVTTLAKVARLDEERLAQLGVDLKRHRGDLMHDIDALRQQLEQSAQAASTGSHTPARLDDDDDSPDPFSEDLLTRRAAENREETDRRLEEERQRLQKENERWREEERARLRRELEQEEERSRQKERDTAAKRLEEERQALEVKRREVERQAERVKEEQEERKKQERERQDRQERERHKQEQEDERRRQQRDKEDQERAQKRREEDAAERQRKEREEKEREEKERRTATSSSPASTTPAWLAKEEPAARDNEPATDSDGEEEEQAAPPRKASSGAGSDRSFADLVEDVRDDTCETNWVAFYFDKASNSIKLTGCGSKGHKELLAHLDDDKVQYAMLRAMDQKRRIKFIYIHWVGSKSHAFLKARSGTKKAEMLKLMGQFHVEMPAETKDDISKEAILGRLSAVSAVNF